MLICSYDPESQNKTRIMRENLERYKNMKYNEYGLKSSWKWINRRYISLNTKPNKRKYNNRINNWGSNNKSEWNDNEQWIQIKEKWLKNTNKRTKGNKRHQV